MSDTLWYTSAIDLADQIASGSVSAESVIERHLQRIDERNERTNAFIDVFHDSAREAARAADAALSNGESTGSLHGVPVAVKDLIPVADQPMSYGAAPLADSVATVDAPAVSRLREAGAIIIGKTNTSEFGHVATTDNEFVGATRTPYDRSRTAGGSSGGSSAAVADGLVPIALGTDAGGSIRIPASACNVYGLKPSFGRVPERLRPNAFRNTMPFTDTGPLARTVADAALVLEIIAGPDPTDPFSIPRGPADQYHPLEAQSLTDSTIGYTPDFGSFPVDDRVEQVVENTLATLEREGATIERAEFPHEDTMDELQAISRVLFQSNMAATVEQSESTFGIDLSEYENDLSPSFTGMAKQGRDHQSIDQAAANVARTELYDAVTAVFESYDLLVTPTLTVPPFEASRPGPESVDGTAIDPYTGWYLTQPFNMTGHPAASVPAGFTDDGLPVGCQLVGPRHADGAVLTMSHRLEQANPWEDGYPPN